MTTYTMVVDLDRCQGCRACMEACKIENNTTEGVFWMYVFRLEEGEYPTTQQTYLPRPCQHCNNAPCVKVCPVGARYRREDGVVLTDSDRCIGCRYCELACPYGVNYFNWGKPKERYYGDWDDPDIQAVTSGAVPPWSNPDLARPHGEEQRMVAGGGHQKGVMEKCTFCVQLVERGEPPACVATCPVGALRFGDRDDPDTPISRFIREHDHFRLLDELGTDPNVVYVGGQPPSDEAHEIELVHAGVER